MDSVYQQQELMRQSFEQRLEQSARRRLRNTAERRSRVRNTLQRAIEAGLRYGIAPIEVEREFANTLQRVTGR